MCFLLLIFFVVVFVIVYVYDYTFLVKDGKPEGGK